jgi:hypothetical protein
MRAAFNFFLLGMAFVAGCHPLSSEHKAKALSQQLEIVWVISIGSTSNIQLQGLSDKLKIEEINQLNAAGVKGVLYVRAAGEHGGGHDKKARIVIVMSNQIRSTMDLPQPDGTNVIYLQKGDNFQMLPKNTPTLAATIHLMPTRQALDPKQIALLTDCTEYEIVREDGGVYGGTAFIWGN